MSFRLPSWLAQAARNAAPAKSTAAQAAADPRIIRGETEALTAAVASFLGRTGLFDREAYARLNPDAAKSGMEPLHHFVRVGIHGGRSFTSQQTIARLWRGVLASPEYAAMLEEAAAPPRAPANPERFRIGIYVSSLGNFFMREIAEILEIGLREAGANVDLLDENTRERNDLTHRIVVAPHEFFMLGEGRRWATDAFLARVSVLSTEQIQTSWFARSLPFILRAKSVFEMNLQSAAILKKAGLSAAPLQPGYSAGYAPFMAQRTVSDTGVFAGCSPEVRSYDVTRPDFAGRPLDVVFLGQHSPRREGLLAGYAATFANLNTFIYYSKAPAILTPERNPMASPEVTAALYQRAKILINLHRDDYAYFEWWRLMQAFWQKTVVVTEPCFPHPLFKAGEHFFEEAPRHIAHLAAWLARTPEGQEKAEEVRMRAFETLTAQASAQYAAQRLLQFVDTR